MIGFNLHWIYAHLIGDYLIQNDWMSKHKKHNSLICLIHVITYMTPFLLTDLNFIQLILIAGQHYLQDRTKFIAWFCKVTGKFQMDFNKFWGHVIVDNIIHILWMALVANYFA